MSINDGGPAFPHDGQHNYTGGMNPINDGGPALAKCALAEVERLRDDAERYRWLRRKCAATGRAAVRERSGGDAAVSGRRQDGLQGADLTSSPA